VPELLRLQTPDFEFSVWASDISARSRVYHSTLHTRAGLGGVNAEPLPAPELRFSPVMTLAGTSIIESCLVAPTNSLEQGDDALKSELAAPQQHATLTLNTPLFFENTQYQFEWVFFEPVATASLAHRSQAVNEAFRFAAQRGSLPARLTGTINTGNDVGWMRLPLTFQQQGITHTQHIAFEVLPTKMVLHHDLPAMYQAIDRVYPLWRFSLVAKTEQDAAQSKQRGHFPLMWLANFAQLQQRFDQALKVICAAPHSRLQARVANIKAAKLTGHLPYKLGEQVKQDFANGQYDKRYRVEKKQLSVDTPENRFIKMAVHQCKRQLAEFEAKLRVSNQAPERQRLSDAFLNELHTWQLPLQKVLNQSFLKDVGAYAGLNRESLVLQQKTGYSAVYRVWQELRFYLDVFGNQSSISMKSVAEIYEVWCFLCLKQILEQELGFELVSDRPATLSQNDFFEYQLKDGFAGAFEFKRADGVTARLAHEPKFTKKGMSIRSYLVNQEPDIVLEVTLPKNASAGEEKQFIWLFDAKYRIKTDKNRFDDDNDENIVHTDYVPDDAINQMHRYRDALIRLASSDNNTQNPHEQITDKRHKKSRPVFGAFALYPGFFDQANEPNPYANAIEEIGIGAFALLPTQVGGDCNGHRWLLEFLQSQIGAAPSVQTGPQGEIAYPMAKMVEHLYVQEAARIPYYGMRQMLYSDLTMTIALDREEVRDNAYFDAFEQGTAHWYHLQQKTFLAKFKQHIAEEIRYLALASTSDTHSNAKQIDRLWPVKRVSLVPRYTITLEQAGKQSSAEELYYLFELSRPLKLQRAVINVAHQPIKYSMKLTTLTRLENVTEFSDVEEVYVEAMV
jgi:hypothetical protein